jgi:hypothetical protein
MNVKVNEGIYELTILISVLTDILKFDEIKHYGCKITSSILSETEQHRLHNSVVTVALSSDKYEYDRK